MTKIERALNHIAGLHGQPTSYARLAELLDTHPQYATTVVHELLRTGRITVVSRDRQGTVYRVISSSEKAVA